MRILLATILAFGLITSSVASQSANDQRIVVVSADALLQNSAYGQGLLRDYAQKSAALAAENRMIEEELAAEEQALTTQRATLPADEFRQLADAFDAKVKDIRAARDAKARQHQEEETLLQRQFFNDILPILNTLMDDMGAQIMLEARSVFLRREAVDITQTAINRIDAALAPAQ